ncbi:MAG: carbamoyl-phosphate synthase large subunit [Elusimicrobiota bacterium]|nr:carbamoyl-phosphate synthase large subunit [Endomicrobiia bacterium]MDW8165269.1 carbamoyl-phosphate synthase large subunit [Elusimicrobiota bacterium]
MPKRKDIKKILIIGSGPIVIGQACEFDYSGTQAIKALKKEGYKVVLVNSNPATIMTDPEFADATYVEPLIPEVLEKIIEKERPDAILPTLGGQTGLNLSVKLYEYGILNKYNVELIGAKVEAIRKGEDRKLFKETMMKEGLDLPRSGFAYTLSEAEKIAKEIGFPLIIRPSFTLGGTGSKIVFNEDEFIDAAKNALQSSMISEILIEEYLNGWKEYELEVMRDCKDNCVIVCSIENFDPMGVHTGDSITVAPAQTLTDKEYQRMRDMAFKCIRAVGVETGGSNIQFAVDPKTGRIVIIEMNPRVSRSSALASKATGFPIAKIAALLAVGYTLDEIPNDITKKTPACFEPTIDYVVVKIPKFAFEKFKPVMRNGEIVDSSYQILGSQMKSIGEVMAIGRTFKEALQKAIRGLEINRFGLGSDLISEEKMIEEMKFLSEESPKKQKFMEMLRYKLIYPNCDRIFNIRIALKLGMSVDEISELSKIDRWFINQMKEIVDMEENIRKFSANKKTTKQDLIQLIKEAKSYGFSDKQLAFLLKKDEEEIIKLRTKEGILPNYKVVDTCAAEFEAYTPYFYSTYNGLDSVGFVGGNEEDVDIVSLTNESVNFFKNKKGKVIVLGSGPNRIGQGIEFDYCCVHAVMAIKEENLEAIMVNCNPETVSTDYDISDKLYFESVTFEDVLNVYKTEELISKKTKVPLLGVILQFGGQTPLNISLKLKSYGAKVLGTQPENIALAEDRELFARVLTKLKLPYPSHGYAKSYKEALNIVKKIGYPVIVRPSYVLGGRAMEIIYDENTFKDYVYKLFEHEASMGPSSVVIIDRFLEDAIELDVDAICDGKDVFVAGIMEHIEAAGIHSGDSACVIPPISLNKDQIKTIFKYVDLLANELKVKGLMNLQLAIKDGTIYVLEVNPRASRTVPYVSKTIGLPIAKIATKVMLGYKLRDLLNKYNFDQEKVFNLGYYTVKEVVLPFQKFSNVDIVLSPEMRSTGEVMGIDKNFPLSYAKSQFAAGSEIPMGGKVLLSVDNKNKAKILDIAKQFKELGFELIATSGTAEFLIKNGIECKKINKISEGRPNVVDLISNKEVMLVINTPTGKGKSFSDGFYIRRTAIVNNIPIITTIEAARCVVNSIKELKNNYNIFLNKPNFEVRSLQSWYKMQV